MKVSTSRDSHIDLYSPWPSISIHGVESRKAKSRILPRTGATPPFVLTPSPYLHCSYARPARSPTPTLTTRLPLPRAGFMPGAQILNFFQDLAACVLPRLRLPC